MAKIKYTQINKEEFDVCIKNEEFKNVYNKINKLKSRLERIKKKILRPKNNETTKSN